MLEQTTNHGERTSGDWRLTAEKLKAVGYAFRADSLHRNVHVDDLFKTDRILVIALGIDSRPTDRLPLDLANYAQPDTA